jgi:hypothetical protein
MILRHGPTFESLQHEVGPCQTLTLFLSSLLLTMSNAHVMIHQMEVTQNVWTKRGDSWAA